MILASRRFWSNASTSCGVSAKLRGREHQAQGKERAGTRDGNKFPPASRERSHQASLARLRETKRRTRRGCHKAVWQRMWTSRNRSRDHHGNAGGRSRIACLRTCTGRPLLTALPPHYRANRLRWRTSSAKASSRLSVAADFPPDSQSGRLIARSLLMP